MLLLVHTIIVILRFAPALANPMPQGLTTADKDKSSAVQIGKCSVPQYAEMVVRLKTCEKAQEREHNSLLSSHGLTHEDIRRAICNTTWAKVRHSIQELYFSIFVIDGLLSQGGPTLLGWRSLRGG